MRHSSDQRMSVAVLERSKDFAALEEEWDDLYEDAPLATPFQSWAWLYSWWETYGEGYELRLVVVRAGGGLLAGVLPLMLERGRWGFGKLLFVGTGLTCYLDMIARQGMEEEVSEAGVRALERMGSWHVADLHQLRPEAAAWGIFQRWNRHRHCDRQIDCPVIDLRPWDEMVGTLSKNLRSTVRRTLRRVETDGVRTEVAEPADAERAARKLVALHREAWQGRDIGLEHLTQRFESHVVAAARRMTARGLGGISEFWGDGEVIISNFWVSGGDFFGTYMLGATQQAIRRYQWSSLYIWDAVRNALDRGCSEVDLLRGEEPYKLRWSSRVVANHRVFLGRNAPTWATYTAYHVFRFKVVRFEQSETAPRWVKGAIRAVGRIKRRGRW